MCVTFPLCDGDVDPSPCLEFFGKEVLRVDDCGAGVAGGLARCIEILCGLGGYYEGGAICCFDRGGELGEGGEVGLAERAPVAAVEDDEQDLG